MDVRVNPHEETENTDLTINKDGIGFQRQNKVADLAAKFNSHDTAKQTATFGNNGLYSLWKKSKKLFGYSTNEESPDEEEKGKNNQLQTSKNVAIETGPLMSMLSSNDKTHFVSQFWCSACKKSFSATQADCNLESSSFSQCQSCGRLAPATLAQLNFKFMGFSHLPVNKDVFCSIKVGEETVYTKASNSGIWKESSNSMSINVADINDSVEILVSQGNPSTISRKNNSSITVLAKLTFSLFRLNPIEASQRFVFAFQKASVAEPGSLRRMNLLLGSDPKTTWMSDRFKIISLNHSSDTLKKNLKILSGGDPCFFFEASLKTNSGSVTNRLMILNRKYFEQQQKLSIVNSVKTQTKFIPVKILLDKPIPKSGSNVETLITSANVPTQMLEVDDLPSVGQIIKKILALTNIHSSETRNILNYCLVEVQVAGGKVVDERTLEHDEMNLNLIKSTSENTTNGSYYALKTKASIVNQLQEANSKNHNMENENENENEKDESLVVPQGRKVSLQRMVSQSAPTTDAKNTLNKFKRRSKLLNPLNEDDPMSMSPTEPIVYSESGSTNSKILSVNGGSMTPVESCFAYEIEKIFQAFSSGLSTEKAKRDTLAALYQDYYKDLVKENNQIVAGNELAKVENDGSLASLDEKSVENYVPLVSIIGKLYGELVDRDKRISKYETQLDMAIEELSVKDERIAELRVKNGEMATSNSNDLDTIGTSNEKLAEKERKPKVEYHPIGKEEELQSTIKVLKESTEDYRLKLEAKTRQYEELVKRFNRDIAQRNMAVSIQVQTDDYAARDNIFEHLKTENEFLTNSLKDLQHATATKIQEIQEIAERKAKEYVEENVKVMKEKSQIENQMSKMIQELIEAPPPEMEVQPEQIKAYQEKESKLQGVLRRKEQNIQELNERIEELSKNYQDSTLKLKEENNKNIEGLQNQLAAFKERVFERDVEIARLKVEMQELLDRHKEAIAAVESNIPMEEKRISNNLENEAIDTILKQAQNQQKFPSTDLPQSKQLLIPILKKKKNQISQPSSSSADSMQQRKQISFEAITIFLDSAIEGDLEEMKRLIETEHMNVNSCNEDGITALHCAACNGHIHIIEYLLQKGAIVNVKDSDQWTPLHGAVCLGNAEIVAALVKAGADVEAINDENETPIDLVTDNETLFNLLQDVIKSKYASEILTAIYDFRGSSDDEIKKIKCGEKIKIINRELVDEDLNASTSSIKRNVSPSDWWLAELVSEPKERGLIPKTTVQ